MSDKKMAPKRPDYEGSDGESYGRPSKRSRMMEKDTDEYQKRRERNNIAVKKSRERSRQKAKETIEQVNRLRAENEMLEQKVEILSKELSVLKDLFLAHAGSVAQSERAIEATESRGECWDYLYQSDSRQHLTSRQTQKRSLEWLQRFQEQIHPGRHSSGACSQRSWRLKCSRL